MENNAIGYELKKYLQTNGINKSFEQKDIQFLRKAIKSIKSESQRTKTFAKNKTNEMAM